MKTSSKIAIAAAAVGAWLIAKKKGVISGIGATPSFWDVTQLLDSLGWAYTSWQDVWIPWIDGKKKMGVYLTIEPYPQNLDHIVPADAEKVKAAFVEKFKSRCRGFGTATYRYAPEIKKMTVTLIGRF